MDKQGKKAVFSDYMKEQFFEKGLDGADVLISAGIPLRYGRSVLSLENRSAHRDIIIRICFAAGFTVSETDKALKLYCGEGLTSEGRDLAVRELLTDRPRDILEFNSILHKRHFRRLLTSGRQK